MLLVYNCYWYVYKEGRSKVFFIFSFYIFALIIVISRFLNYVLLLIYFYDKDHNSKTLLTAQDI
jgi:hypothetical protein